MKLCFTSRPVSTSDIHKNPEKRARPTWKIRLYEAKDKTFFIISTVNPISAKSLNGDGKEKSAGCMACKI